MQKILSTSESVYQLRAAHDRLIHDYIAPAPVMGSNYSDFEIRRDESFEHKGNYWEGKEKKVAHQEVSLPPAYEEDQSINIHILGGVGIIRYK